MLNSHHNGHNDACGDDHNWHSYIGTKRYGNGGQSSINFVDNLGDGLNVMGSSQQALMAVSSADESDALVASAGTSAANGTYTYTGTANGKRYYNKSGTSDTVSAISWNGTQWTIWGSGGEEWYRSTEDTTYPWEVSSWDVRDSDPPAPTVTEA